MKSSVFQGKNISTLNYSFFATFKFFDNIKNSYFYKPFNNFFDKIKSIKTLTYTVESSSQGLPNHAHALIEISGNENNFISEIEKKLKPKKVIEGSRRQIIKFLKNENDLKNDVIFKDKYVVINFKKLICTKMEIHIEKIVLKENSSYYTLKFSDWGINNNSLIR